MIDGIEQMEERFEGMSSFAASLSDSLLKMYELLTDEQKEKFGKRLLYDAGIEVKDGKYGFREERL